MTTTPTTPTTPTFELVTGCTCTPAWPGLSATIDGVDRAAEPTEDHSAAETTAEAFCTGCGIAYPGHWTLTPIADPEREAKVHPPETATDLLRLIVAQRPNGEVRPQQERMVGLVEDAIKNKTHLLVQAGTGTGKSLGYLIPAIKQARASGKRVVVSTATKQLGEQIVSEDMPTLAEIIPKVGGPSFSYALIKGRQNYACFAGETQVITRDGNREIRDLVGTRPTLIDGNGQWVECDVEEFGDQQIVELTVRRDGLRKTIRTTADHRWFVQKNANFVQHEEVITKDLVPGMKLAYKATHNTVKDGKQVRPSPFGVAAGFTFGDGSVFAPTKNGSSASVLLHGEKDKALLPFFAASHKTQSRLSEDHADEFATRVWDLPVHFKRLPDPDEAPSYLYGWLAGYFAADGSIGTGIANLHSATREHLEHASLICTRLGIRHGEIRQVERESRFTNGKKTPLYWFSINLDAVTDDFFIIHEHRRKVDEYKAARTYKKIRAARRWIVESVRFTEDCEPVYCAVVPSTESFVLVGNILTGNCRREVDSLVRLDEEGGEVEQDALFDAPVRENSRRPTADDLKKLNSLLQWADTTQTGDRTEAPAVPDKVWDQISTDAGGCAGKSCPFYEDCFAEQARSVAREADVVVTNHAQVAQDLRSEFPLLGEYDVLVTDEVHELESYLSSAWGLEVAPSSMKHHLAQAARKLSKGEKYEQARETASKALDDIEALEEMLADVGEGLQPVLPDNVTGLLVAIGTKLRTVMSAFEMSAGEKDISQQTSAERKGAAGKVGELCEAVVAMCADMSDGTNVRWLEAGFGTRGPSLKVAPLWIGPKLMTLLEDRTLIATSATMTVGGTFDAFIRTLALREPIIDAEGKAHQPRKFDAVDVGTPFDYDKQAMFYIPANTFPAPVGQEREAHTAAVKDEVTALVKAAGGRTLALFTTRRGAEAAAAHLRANVSTPVLCQGDAPPSQLIAEFKEDETATLCATMGFWHGVDAPGTTLLCVVLDKVPFAPMNDPLMSARRTAVDADRPGRGFDEVYVAGASVMLSQGVGRLIRTANDKGVVAILDTRIMTKGYGRTMIASMPRMRQFRDRAVIEGALTRLAAAADAALPDRPTSISGARQTAKAAAATQAARSVTVPARKAAPRKTTTRAIAKGNKRPA